MINNKEIILLYKELTPKITKYLRKYYTIISKDSINDIKNDIFMKLYDNYDYLPKDSKEINSYVYVTCRNYVLNYKKSLKTKPKIEYIDDDDLFNNYTIGLNNIETDYITNEYYNYKISKMDRLNQDIINYKNMGYSLTEISKITKNSRSNIYRAFKLIKENDNI